MMAAPIDRDSIADMPPVLEHRSSAEAARVLAARHAGKDTVFNNVSTDTRSIAKGDLFIALTGPNFDGHDFISEAERKGAAVVLVSREVQTTLPQIIVDDTRLALGQLAAAWRAGFDIPLIAVTGSNGKTTVKEMLAAIFQQMDATLVTEGNLNNDIGMPLTLLRLDEQHRYVVIEMGANHPGEIAYLSGLAQPNIAVITNAGAAHLEGFSSLEGVASAKGEIFSGLQAHGIAVVNADDAYRDLWLQLADDYKRLSFGLDAPADVTARWHGDATGSDLQMTLAGDTLGVRLHLPGRHNVMNALAASAAAIVAGAGIDAIKRGLESMRAVKGRMQACTGKHGSLIIDDTYNANPFSLQAALQVLALSEGKKILVLGDMGELGKDATSLHAQVGSQARESGVDALYTVGELSKDAVNAFGEGARHYLDHEALVMDVVNELEKNVTVLVKGSRFMHMEEIVKQLVNTE